MARFKWVFKHDSEKVCCDHVEESRYLMNVRYNVQTLCHKWHFQCYTWINLVVNHLSINCADKFEYGLFNLLSHWSQVINNMLKLHWDLNNVYLDLKLRVSWGRWNKWSWLSFAFCVIVTLLCQSFTTSST